jgi:hypothetical protein
MHSVLVRMFIYVLSPLLATGVALVPGWGVAYADGVLSIHLETVIGAAVAAAGLSGAIFAKWGIR